MSLLTICQAACNSVPIAAPSSIVTNTNNETAMLLLALANDAGEDLARRPQGGWVAMINEYDFQTNAIPGQTGTIENTGPNGWAVITGLSNTTGIETQTWICSGLGVPNGTKVLTAAGSTVTLMATATATGVGQFQFGQSDYALPVDFERPIDNTFWDRTRYWQMRGPQSPQQWQLYKSSIIGRATIERRYRFRQVNGTTTLSIDPVPFDNAAQLVFEYVSNGWCKGLSNVLTDDFGNVITDDFGNPLGSPYQSSWQADADVGVLPEYLLRLGLKWRLLRRLGMSYSEELSEYERQVDKAMASDGAAAILDLTPGPWLNLLSPFNVQDGYYPGRPSS